MCFALGHNTITLALTIALIGNREKKIQSILRLHKLNKVEKRENELVYKKM